MPLLSNQKVGLLINEKGQSSSGCLAAETLIVPGGEVDLDQKAGYGHSVTGRLGLF